MSKTIPRSKISGKNIVGKPVLRKANTSAKVTLPRQKVEQKVDDLLLWLQGSNKSPTIIRSALDDIDLAVEGVSKASIDNLASRLGVSKKKMAEDILSVSVKTLERKSASDKLDKRTSSHAIEIARVMQHAYAVFEDGDKVKSWMNQDNRALNGEKPLLLLETLSGINLINDVLGRIEEGVYS